MGALKRNPSGTPSSLELREVGVPRGLRVRDRLRLARQAALAHEAADREARRVGELARL